jgi:ferrous iron transport protein B
MSMPIIDIVLAGNPNCGKTSIFNAMCKTRQKVGNFPGVTVEKKTGHVFRSHCRIRVTDLPGTYSLNVCSPDEKIARQHILDNNRSIIVNVIDGTNCDRNFFLTTQLMELQRPMIVAVNMSDEMESRGLKMDFSALSEELGLPVIPTVGNSGKNVDKLLETVEEMYSQYFAAEGSRAFSPRLHVAQNAAIQAEIENVASLLRKNSLDSAVSPEWLAARFLEKDQCLLPALGTTKSGEELSSQLRLSGERIVNLFDEEAEVLMTEARYAFINSLLERFLIHGTPKSNWTENLDQLLLHRVFGLPIFLLVVFLIFQLVFTIGEYPMALIESGVQSLSDLISTYWGQEKWPLLRSLVLDGLISGVGGVLVFLPNIVLLFLGIALLDGTGYIARAAFLMDKIMRVVGLHGKSFLPMICGLGCTVPAVMATRCLENEKDRFTTLMVLPLISCNARFIVYAMLIPIFFPIQQRGFVLLSLYLFGVFISVLVARFLRSTLLKGGDSSFMMEVPPLRMPTLTFLLLEMWERAKIYLTKVAKIILSASIVLWVMANFPAPDESVFAVERETLALMSEHENYDELLADFQKRQRAAALEYSFIGRLGRFLEPVFEPVGFNWKIVTAFLFAVPAKEIFVTQFSLLYGVEHEEDEGGGAAAGSALRRALLAEHYQSGHFMAGKPVYTPLMAVCIMIFCMLSTPCIGTTAAIIRETNSYLWGVGQFFGLTALAWLVTFMVFRLGLFLQIGTAAIATHSL